MKHALSSVILLCLSAIAYANPIDEEDARQFYLGQTERKRDLGGKYNALALDDSYDEPYETDEDEED